MSFLLPQRKSFSIPCRFNPDVVQKEIFVDSTFLTDRQAASFTSTRVPVAYDLEYRALTQKEIRQEMYKAIKKQKKKGYVRLETSLGPLNLELHCDKVPETCHNFLLHCQTGYYNDTIFHRSIKNFMIQGGDPTGTGTGGISAFGKEEPEFPDEFHPHLVHKGPGVLSMANSGKNTNRSQFFITYNSCEHLNQQHTVFGRLVGGFETLKKMQQVPTTTQDAPISKIQLLLCRIYENPFQDYMLQEKKKTQSESESAKTPTVELLDPMANHAKRDSLQIGKYVDFKRLSQQHHSLSSKKHTTPTPRVIPSELKRQCIDVNKQKLLFADW